MKKQKPQFPILQIPTNSRIRDAFVSPILFLPIAEYPDETFVPLSRELVPNQMPNRYIVSNYGYIWDCYMNQRCPERSNSPDKTAGYLRCHIACYSDPFHITSVDVYMHRAVLMSYNYRPGCEVLEVDHKDTDKWNNKLSNLQWSTGLQNIVNALNAGLTQNGLVGTVERNMLTEAQVYDVCMRRASNQTIAEISRDTGISIYAVRNIVKRRTFCHISAQFDFPDLRNDKAIPDSIVHDICKDMQLQGSNVDNYYIADKYDISVSTVRDIRAGRSYKDIRSQYTGIITGGIKRS